MTSKSRADIKTETHLTSRPLRVLVVDTAIAFGGTLALVRNLLKNINHDVADTTLVSACSDGFVSKNFAGDVRVTILRPRVDYVTLAKWKERVDSTFSFKTLRRLTQIAVISWGMLANVPYTLRLLFLCRRLGADIMHVNNYAAEPLWAARLAGIPIIFHLHGFVLAPLERFSRRNFRHVRVFVPVSIAVAQSAIRAGIDQARICTIPNFIESAPGAAPPPPPSVPAIGIFGRVIPWKGQKQFLAAAMRVLPHFPDLRVLIVGGASDGDPSYFEECREIAASSPYSDRIEFSGLTADVERYYRRCTIVVHASIEPEPFGMVLIEAMAQARPVIASPFGAPPEIIENGREGFIVDPNDAAALSDRIKELLVNPDLAVTMGNRGLEKVKALYDPAVGARRFECLYADVARLGLRSRHWRDVIKSKPT